MTERTERDELIDRAIEQLIDEDTEGFAVVTVESDDVHLMRCTDHEEHLLATFMLVEQFIREAEKAGVEMEPGDVLAGAADQAEARGLLANEATWRELDIRESQKPDD